MPQQQWIIGNLQCFVGSRGRCGFLSLKDTASCPSLHSPNDRPWQETVKEFRFIMRARVSAFSTRGQPGSSVPTMCKMIAARGIWYMMTNCLRRGRLWDMNGNTPFLYIFGYDVHFIIFVVFHTSTEKRCRFSQKSKWNMSWWYSKWNSVIGYTCGV